MRRSTIDKPNEYHSAIAGVMSGPEFDTRQAVLEEIKEIMEHSKKALFLDVIPQPDNPHDRDALALYFNSPSFGRVHIGYVRNSSCVCDFCGQNYERFPQSGTCKRCGHSDELRREGLASKLAKEIRVDPTCHFYAQIIQVTGGIGQKNFGCNIIIRRHKASVEGKPWESSGR